MCCFFFLSFCTTITSGIANYSSFVNSTSRQIMIMIPHTLAHTHCSDRHTIYRSIGDRTVCLVFCAASRRHKRSAVGLPLPLPLLLLIFADALAILRCCEQTCKTLSLSLLLRPRLSDYQHVQMIASFVWHWHLLTTPTA